MVTIGSLTWVSKVENAGRAQQKADKVGNSMEQASEKAENANQSFSGVSGSLRGVSDSAKRTAGRFGRLTAMTAILRSALQFLGVTMGSLGFGGLLSGLAGGLTSLLGITSFGALVSRVSLTALVRKIPAIATLITGLSLASKLIKGDLTVDDLIQAPIELGHMVTFGLLDNEVVEGAIGSIILTVGAFQLAKGLGAMLPSIGLGALLTKLPGAGALAGLLGTVSLGTVVAGVGSIAALIGGVAMLTDLVDGDISDWNIPGQIARDLGEGFRRAHPDMASTVRDVFTKNPFFDAGRTVRNEGLWGSIMGGSGELESSTAAFVDPRQGWKWTGFQSGGMVQQTGPAMVHEGEAVLPSDLVQAITAGAGGGGSRGPTIETVNVEIGDQQLNLSNLSRIEMEDLADAIAQELGTEVENII